MNASEIFSSMEGNFNAEAAKGLDAVFQFEFSNDDSYFVAITDCKKDVQQGTHDSPTVTILTDTDTLERIISGSTNAVTAFMGGKLKAQGDIMLAQKLTSLFPS